jgi:hypothetical protein
MAQGDVVVFDATFGRIGEGEYDLPADTFKIGIVDDTITPTAADTTPTWGDYSTNEVSGTNYPTGGVTLTSVTYTGSSGTWTFDSGNVNLAQSGTGFADGYWGILYDDTHASDEALLFIDLGGPAGNTVEAFQIIAPTDGWIVIARKVA